MTALDMVPLGWLGRKTSTQFYSFFCYRGYFDSSVRSGSNRPFCRAFATPLSFVDTDHETFSTVILSLPLIQEE